VVTGFAQGLGRELEEHLLQAGAVGGPQFGGRYPGDEGDLPDLRGFGLGEQSVLADR